jgi:hypothetical protein
MQATRFTRNLIQLSKLIPVILIMVAAVPANAAKPGGKIIRLQAPVLSESHGLVDAIDDNNPVRVRAYFDKGFSPVSTIKNKLKESLLDRAASNGSDRAFEVVLSEIKLQGLKPRLTDSRGTPLIVVLASLAVSGRKTTERYERMATALIQVAPESLNLTDRAYVGDGRTALHQAAASGNVRLIRAFISHGANVNAKNTSGETPLHLAARFGHIDAVRYLVSAGANIHAKTRYTKATPLMAAAEMGQETVIRVLMASGAQKDERDFFGKSAPERYKEYSANFYNRMYAPKVLDRSSKKTPSGAH